MDAKTKTKLGCSCFVIFAVAMTLTIFVGATFVPTYFGLLIGGIGLVVSLVLLLALKKVKKLPIFLVAANGLFSSFCVATVFNYIKTGFDFVSSLICLGVVLLLLVLYHFVALLPIAKKRPLLFFSLKLSAILIGLVVLAAMLTSALTILMIFYFLTYAIFVIGFCVKAETAQRFLENMAICSFGALIVAFFVALIFVSDGDCLDIVSGGATTKDKKNKFPKIKG